jgi:hypothetical protein
MLEPSKLKKMTDLSQLINSHRLKHLSQQKPQLLNWMKMASPLNRLHLQHQSSRRMIILKRLPLNLLWTQLVFLACTRT